MTARSFEYAKDHPDIGFAVFMDRIDRAVMARSGLSVFDFADAMWADLYEGHRHCAPTDDEVFAVLAEVDGTFARWLDRALG